MPSRAKQAVSKTILCVMSGCGREFASSELFDLHMETDHQDGDNLSDASSQELISPAKEEDEADSQDAKPDPEPPRKRAKQNPKPNAKQTSRQSTKQMSNKRDSKQNLRRSESPAKSPQPVGQAPAAESHFECEWCGDEFDNVNEFRSHQKNEHQVRLFKCRKCGELFRSIADRQTHKNNKHFSNISCQIVADNFKEYEIGDVVASSRSE